MIIEYEESRYEESSRVRANQRAQRQLTLCVGLRIRLLPSSAIGQTRARANKGLRL